MKSQSSRQVQWTEVRGSLTPAVARDRRIFGPPPAGITMITGGITKWRRNYPGMKPGRC